MLKEIQDAVGAKYGKDKPFDLVFHGGSGSALEDIREAISYGVVKMNVDTDTQYAFTRPVAGHMFTNYDGVLKIDGEVGNKKAYDPRAWGKAAEAGDDRARRPGLPGPDVGRQADGLTARGKRFGVLWAEPPRAAAARGRHRRVMKARNSMITGTDRNTDPPAIAALVLPTRATASEKNTAEMLIIAVVRRMAKVRIRSAAPGSCRSYSPRMSGGGSGPDQARGGMEPGRARRWANAR